MQSPARGDAAQGCDCLSRVRCLIIHASGRTGDRRERGDDLDLSAFHFRRHRQVKAPVSIRLQDDGDCAHARNCAPKSEVAQAATAGGQIRWPARYPLGGHPVGLGGERSRAPGKDQPSRPSIMRETGGQTAAGSEQVPGRLKPARPGSAVRWPSPPSPLDASQSFSIL